MNSGCRPYSKRSWRLALVVLSTVGLLLGGCSMWISSATSDLAANLAQAVVDNDDPDMVKAGAPAHLLLLDGLLQADPHNTDLLGTAARMYAAYAAAFGDAPQRARKMTAKALDYGLRAVCSRQPDACDLAQVKFEEFSERISRTGSEDVPVLFALGVAWAGWIDARRDDWDAIADIARAEALMQRVVALDESYREGEAHLYLGAFATLFAPALGGKPEVGRRHFERALGLCQERNLMVKVIFARQYARLMLDRHLHDRLLQEVLAADPYAPGYTLTNTLAQQQARQLLDSADNYF